ncbi:hypothetical protein LCGC14_1323570, partial [marine sediment metagenome]
MPKQEKMPFGVTKPEENKSFQIYEEVSAIRELIETGGIKIEKSKKDSVPEVIKLVTKPFEKMMDNIVSEKTKDEAKPINKTDEKGIDESLKESNKEQKGFLKGLAEKFTETVKSVSDSIGKIGKGIAEASFNMLLGPLQLITKPLEEMMGGKIFDKLLGVLTPKKFKGKPTKQKVLPKDPGAVLIASTLEEEAKEKKKGIWGKIGAGLLAALPFILAGLTLVGTLLSDLFGEGGAISFFKKGEIGKGIMTLLFGKDLSEKGPGGKIIGILKQGAKWAAVGFMLGSVIPGVGNVLGALIGFGIGAIASTIKLGIDSGFFKKIGGQIKDKTKEMGGIKGLFKSVIKWTLILGPGIGSLFGVVMFYFGDKIKGFTKKIFTKMKGAITPVMQKVAQWGIAKIIEPLRGLFGGIFDNVSNFLMSGFEATIDIGKQVIGWVEESILSPIANIFKRIGNKIVTFKDEKNDSILKADATGNFNFNGTSPTETLTRTVSDVTNFSVCILPASQSLTGDYDITYSATNYPQRILTVDPAVFSSTTQTRDLLLLNTNDGIFTTFRVIDAFQNPLDDTSVSFTKATDTVIIESKLTDDSGTVSFFINPDQSYIFTFTKSGFVTSTFTLTITDTEVRTITLESAAAAQVTSFFASISYFFEPKNEILNNDTNINFRFNSTSSFWDITDCSFKLRNASEILSQTSCQFNGSQSNASIIFFTGNQSIITAEATWE